MPQSVSLARESSVLRIVLLSLGLAAVLGLSPALAQKPDDPGMAKFRGAAFPVDEEAGEVTIVVKRLRGSTGEVEVSYETTEGTATEGEDYEETSGTLSWGDGDRSDKTFTVTILDDDDDEGQETFGVVLFDPTNGLELSPPSSALVRIKPSDRSDDDDEDDGEDDGEEEEEESCEVELTAVAFPAFESSLVAEVSVEREEGCDGEVTVDFLTIAASADEGDDYMETQGTLTWPAGEDGVMTFEVPLVDDDEPEELETITVVLTNPTGGAELGSPAVGSIVIIDDDGGEGGCIANETTLCLLDGRFQVTGTWRDFEDNTGDIHWIPSSDESGLGWFFSESNIELLLKLLDGCVLNDRFWVFFAATTNVEYDIVVADLETGAENTYHNDLGVVATAITDTGAFECSSP